MRTVTLSGTSNSGTILSVGTPDSSTGRRSKSTTSTWNSRSQRELTVNQLSGKLGADQAGRRIPASQAAEHIAGYMIANDVSARDLMEGESRKLSSPVLLQIMRAKGWDTFLPTGPWLVTADEAGSYENIRIQTWVNDEARQDAYAKEMTNNPYQIIEWLSATTTLQPGDIITTGTPAGVAMGMATPQWLTPGDTIRIHMTGLGTMTTPVHQEQAAP